MKKATYMGIGSQTLDHEIRVFHVEPPLDGYEYVSVSARDMSEMTSRLASGLQIPTDYLGIDLEPETFIFGCNISGTVVSWAELEGSFRGEMNIARALQNAGYTIVDQKVEK